MKSRLAVVASYLLFLSGVILAIVAIFVDVNSIWRGLLLVPLVVGAIPYSLCSKCPHCGKFGLKVRPLSKDCGYCNYCGKLVEFEE